MTRNETCCDAHAAQDREDSFNPGYAGADYGDPVTPARITFNDEVAELIATAIQAGVKVSDLQADCDAQLSLHDDPPARDPFDGIPNAGGEDDPRCSEVPGSVWACRNPAHSRGAHR